MNIGYKVGELIYDANIYDGLNTFLSDLQFYKKWLPKNKEAEILELCCGTGDPHCQRWIQRKFGKTDICFNP